MVGLTWLRGLLAHRRGRLLVDRRRRRRRRRAARVDRRRSSPPTKSKMTQRAIARVAGRLAGRGPARRRPARRPRAGRSATGRRAARCRSASRATTGLQRHAPAARPRPPAPAWCSACPPATRARSPASCARSPGSGDRRPARPADRREPPRRARATRHDRPRRARPRPACSVDGVVDLPQADSLFQKVGAPAGAQPQAPPDNVVLLPAATLQQVFDPLARARPDLVRTQVHARCTHRLPGAPAPRSPRSPGAGPQPRDAAGRRRPRRRQPRRDARPGAPGRALRPGAVPVPRRARRRPRRPGHRVVAAAGAGAAAPRAALLRTRGASTRQLVPLALGEAALAGGAGVGARARRRPGHRRRPPSAPRSFGAGTARRRRSGPSAPRSPGSRSPRRRSRCPPGATPARSRSPASAGRSARRDRAPWWARYGLDVVLLGAAALVFWQASRNGYSLVLAPEGVPQISVSTGRSARARARVGRRRPARLADRRPRPRAAAARRGPRAAAARRRALAARSRRRWPASAGCSPAPSRSSR